MLKCNDQIVHIKIDAFYRADIHCNSYHIYIFSYNININYIVIEPFYKNYNNRLFQIYVLTHPAKNT